jgi:hypothetical protein
MNLVADTCPVRIAGGEGNPNRPDPPTDTFTGIVNVAPETLEIVYVPEIAGVEPVCPMILTTSPLENGTLPVQVITVGLATDDETMGFPIICAPVVVIE